MILVDWQIKQAYFNQEIDIDPFDVELINPSSMDIRLGNMFTKIEPSYTYITELSNWKSFYIIDPMDRTTFKNNTQKYQYYELLPGETVLASMYETLSLGQSLSARVLGKSSLARLGLDNSSPAGWIDPGWKGNITLELTNVAKYAIKLTPGMKIGQLVFYKHERVSKSYQQTGRYYDQIAGMGSLGVD